MSWTPADFSMSNPVGAQKLRAEMAEVKWIPGHALMNWIITGPTTKMGKLSTDSQTYAFPQIKLILRWKLAMTKTIRNGALLLNFKLADTSHSITSSMENAWILAVAQVKIQLGFGHMNMLLTKDSNLRNSNGRLPSLPGNFQNAAKMAQ